MKYKPMNKSAISLMISYVILISIVLVLSVGVFSWLRFAADITPEIDCKDDTSVIIIDYECSFEGNPNNLKLTLKNNGRFNVDGIILIVGANAEMSPSTYLIPNIDGGEIPGHYYFYESLNPGDEIDIWFSNAISKTEKVDFTRVEILEIQPFVISHKDKIICQEGVRRQTIKDCTIS